jgi:hypothetical protein
MSTLARLVAFVETLGIHDDLIAFFIVLLAVIGLPLAAVIIILRRVSAHHSSFGCAGMLAAFAALFVWLGYHNHEYWQRRQEQIPRFQKVRATVREKGIAHYTSQDTNGRTRTEDKKWIHFTCHAGDLGDKDGARLTLSGSDDGWASYAQDRDYDAFFDPVANECVLVLDEAVGEPDTGLRGFLFMAKLLGGAAVLFAVGGLFALRRR